MSDGTRGRAHRTAREKCLEGATHCFWCGCWISDDVDPNDDHKATADHILPRSQGGPDHVDNMVPACRKCNIARAAKGTDWRPGLIPDEQAEDW